MAIYNELLNHYTKKFSIKSLRRFCKYQCFMGVIYNAKIPIIKFLRYTRSKWSIVSPGV